MSDTNTYYKVKMQGMYLWSPYGRHLLLCPPKEKSEDGATWQPLQKSYIGQNDDGDLAFVVRDPDGSRHVYPQPICKVQPIPSTIGADLMSNVRVVRVHDHAGPALLRCDVISETTYYNGWPKIKYKTGPRY